MSGLRTKKPRPMVKVDVQGENRRRRDALKIRENREKFREKIKGDLAHETK